MSFANIKKARIRKNEENLKNNIHPETAWIEKILNPVIFFSNIVEFRNSSWWNEVVSKSFKENNITLCSVNHPKLPEEIIATSASIYVRLHGNPNIFYSSYSDSFLSNLHEEITQRNSINKAFVLFNNTASTAGILNAQQIKLYI